MKIEIDQVLSMGGGKREHRRRRITVMKPKKREPATPFGALPLFLTESSQLRSALSKLEGTKGPSPRKPDEEPNEQEAEK